MLNQFYKISNFLKILYFFYFLFSANNAFANDLFDSFFENIFFQSNDIEETKKNKIEELKINNLNKLFKNILTNIDYKKIRNDIDSSFTDKFVRNIIIENENDLSKYFKKNLINDEVVVGMGAGTISRWMHNLKNIL